MEEQDTLTIDRFNKTITGRIAPFSNQEHVDFICESIIKNIWVHAPIAECTVIHYDWKPYAEIVGNYVHDKIVPNGFLDQIINIPNSKQQSILWVICSCGNTDFLRFILDSDQLDIYSKWNFLHVLLYNIDKRYIGHILRCFMAIFERFEREYNNLLGFYELLYDKSLTHPPMYHLCQIMGDYRDVIFQEYDYEKGTKKITNKDDLIHIRKKMEEIYCLI
jgi:hypothetical protein